MLTAVVLGATLMTQRRGCYIALVAASLTVSLVAGYAHDDRKSFDIPVQPLSIALEAFSTASGYQLLVAEAVPVTALSGPVHGMLSPREALSRLIAGAGFEITYTSAQAAILTRSPGKLERDEQRRERLQYDIALQNDAIDILCQNAITQPGKYRAALDIWVAPTGRVRRAELLSSTGNDVRDRQILSALQTMTSASPPSAVTQPTTLIISPQSPTEHEFCKPQASERRAEKQ